MKLYLFNSLILLSLLVSCTSKMTSNEHAQSQIDTTINSEVMVGSDIDENGCKGSAGYSWSKVIKDCIRIWETGIQLKPIAVEGAVFNATIILSEEKDIAELFINTEKSSILLRKEKDEVYKNGDYYLTETSEGWLLKNGTKEIYKNY